MLSSSSSLLSKLCWKTLLLGSLLGYLFAVVLQGPQNPATFFASRHLEEETTTTEVGHHEGTSKGEATGEHGGGEEEGEHHGEHPSAATMDTTLVAIIIFLIAMTIFFEEVKEGLEEEADRTMRPVIDGLFGEMTVLGFLSIVTFCVTKMGLFETISVAVFGEEEKEELLETFEMAHYMLFFIMVFFVVNVLVLVHGGEAMEKTWRAFNTACRDPEYLAKLDALEEDNKPSQCRTSYIQYLFWQNMVVPFRWRTSRKGEREHLQYFRAMRREFVLERSFEPPFAPHLGHKDRVPEDFDFGRYLSICLGHNLQHMVHLSIYTWMVLGLFSLIFYAIAVIIENDKEVRTRRFLREK